MTSPLEAIQGEIERIKDDVRRDAIVFIVRSAIKFGLELLMVVDPKNVDDYKTSLDKLGGPGIIGIV